MGSPGRVKRRGIDLIRDGVSPAELSAKGSIAVFRALTSSALSRVNQGGRFQDWVSDVLDPRSRLGQQLRAPSQRRALTPLQAMRQLEKAWAAAEKFALENPKWDSESAKRETATRQKLIHDWLDSEEHDLTEPQAAVLRYAVDQAVLVGSTVVNLPRRGVANGTGLTERVVRSALEALEELDLLSLVERGKPAGGNASARRANAYAVPSQRDLNAYLCRETRQVGQKAGTGGTSPSAGRDVGCEVRPTNQGARAAEVVERAARTERAVDWRERSLGEVEREWGPVLDERGQELLQLMLELLGSNARP